MTDGKDTLQSSGPVDAIAAAQRVVAELSRRGIASEVDDLSDSDLATVKIHDHDQYSFMVATTDDVENGPGWRTVLNTPADDDPDLCIQIESLLDGLAATAPASDVADGIIGHLAADVPATSAAATPHLDR